jgi:hypothetical protein
VVIWVWLVGGLKLELEGAFEAISASKLKYSSIVGVITSKTEKEKL